MFLASCCYWIICFGMHREICLKIHSEGSIWVSLRRENGKILRGFAPYPTRGLPAPPDPQLNRSLDHSLRSFFKLFRIFLNFTLQSLVKTQSNHLRDNRKSSLSIPYSSSSFFAYLAIIDRPL